MAGLATAHELAERGFKVTVFEPSAWGGKARSIPVPGTRAGARGNLPGEHGFRFFPGFYHHVPNTMRRIPFGKNPNGVGDNLTDAKGAKFLRGGDRADAFLFGVGPDPEALLTIDGMRRFLTETFKGQNVPPDELAYFVSRVLVFMTSSEERRLGQWEKKPWWDFVGAGQRSTDYQHVLAAGLTRNLVAAKETVASTRTIGHMGEAFIFNILNEGNDGALDRVLNLPTDEAWIDPWMAYLRTLGVTFVSNHGLAGYEMRNGQISAVRIINKRGRVTRHESDWYVSAMPVERARTFWTNAMRRQDPQLARMDRLKTDWMVGIQFFLKEKVDITKGHITFIDSPWALTALTQAQFWPSRDFPRDYGDGSVVDCLSIDISNWDKPGMLYKKTAKQCSPEEIAAEVLAQVRYHHTVGDVLPDSIIHSGSSTRELCGTPRPGRTRTRLRCWSTPQAPGRIGPRRPPGFRTFSSAGTSCRPTSIWRPWKEPTSPVDSRPTRSWIGWGPAPSGPRSSRCTRILSSGCSSRPMRCSTSWDCPTSLTCRFRAATDPVLHGQTHAPSPHAAT